MGERRAAYLLVVADQFLEGIFYEVDTALLVLLKILKNRNCNPELLGLAVP